MFGRQQTDHWGLAAEVLALPVGSNSTDQLCSLLGFLSFLWFVAFCFLANQWQRTKMSKGALQGADAARAAIAFSFFSMVVWVSSASGLVTNPILGPAALYPEVQRGSAAPRASSREHCLPLSPPGSEPRAGQTAVTAAGRCAGEYSPRHKLHVCRRNDPTQSSAGKRRNETFYGLSAELEGGIWGTVWRSESWWASVEVTCSPSPCPSAER